MYFEDRLYVCSKRNEEEMLKEFSLIKMEHNLNRNIYTRMNLAYNIYNTLKIGNFKKVIDFLTDTLSKLGYDKSEIDSFLYRNTEIIITDIEHLKFRLSLFNSIGVLEDALLNHYSILTYTSILNIGSKELYAIIMSGKYNIDLNDLSNIYNIPSKELKLLTKKYPLTSEERFRLYFEMRSYLNREERTRKLKKDEY